MMKIGKKIGTYYVTTVLGGYDLGVYACADSNLFSVLVPTTPGAEVELRRRASFELFSGKDLAEVKKLASDFLLGRDVTDYHDVIECDVSYEDTDRHELRFNFVVARVSTAVNEMGNPRLEKQIKVTDDGEIVEELFDGKPEPPRAHSRRWSELVRMPYTVSRWRKCVAIRDGVDKLKEALGQLFDGQEAGSRLDLLDLVSTPRLMEAILVERRGESE